MVFLRQESRSCATRFSIEGGRGAGETWVDIPGSLPEGRGPLSGGLLLSSVLDCFSLSGEGAQWQAHPLHPLSVLRGLRRRGGEGEQPFPLLHPRFRLLHVLVGGEGRGLFFFYQSLRAWASSPRSEAGHGDFLDHGMVVTVRLNVGEIRTEGRGTSTPEGPPTVEAQAQLVGTLTRWLHTRPRSGDRALQGGDSQGHRHQGQSQEVVSNFIGMQLLNFGHWRLRDLRGSLRTVLLRRETHTPQLGSCLARWRRARSPVGSNRLCAVRPPFPFFCFANFDKKRG